MTFDQIIKLLEALAPLLQALMWPFIVVFLWRAFKIYVEDLRKDKSVSEIAVGIGTDGLNFNIKKQVEVATMLIQADVAKQMEGAAPGIHLDVSPAQTESIVNTVGRLSIPPQRQKLPGQSCSGLTIIPKITSIPKERWRLLAFRLR